MSISYKNKSEVMNAVATWCVSNPELNTEFNTVLATKRTQRAAELNAKKAEIDAELRNIGKTVLLDNGMNAITDKDIHALLKKHGFMDVHSIAEKLGATDLRSISKILRKMRVKGIVSTRGQTRNMEYCLSNGMSHIQVNNITNIRAA